MKTYFLKSSSGFTLIELIVAVAILTVLITIAVPRLGNMVANNRTTAHYNKIVGSLNLARSEAVKRNERVRICAGDTASCATTNWENGWVVLTADDVILRAIDALDGYTLRLSQSTSTDMLTYRSNGTLLDSTTATFTLCDETADATKAKAVNVNVMGQPSKARDTDATADNIVNDVTGSNVACP